MAVKSPKAQNPPVGQLTNSEKVRWSLIQRVCEQVRQLGEDLFDNLDDFFFETGKTGQFADYLQAMREVRTGKVVFEKQFIASLSSSLQSDLAGNPSVATTKAAESGRSQQEVNLDAYEIDLAIQMMRNRALRFYQAQSKQLDRFIGIPPENSDAVTIKREYPIRNVIYALDTAHETFNLPVDMRLVLLKLFEQHLLLKMEKVFLDTLRILGNANNDAFVERLYSSTIAMTRKRRDVMDDEPQHSAKVLNLVERKESPVPQGSDGVGRRDAAISDVGKLIIDDQDLNEIMAILGGDQEGAAAEEGAEKESIAPYLVLVDSLTDGAAIIYRQGQKEQVCTLQKSKTVENSYALNNRQGRLVLTRGRIGFAVSLKSGELSLVNNNPDSPPGEGTVLNALGSMNSSSASR